MTRSIGQPRTASKALARSILWGVSVGGLLGLGGAIEAAVEDGTALLSMQSVGIVALGVFMGAIVGPLLRWLAPLRNKGMMGFVVAWTVSCGIAGLAVGSFIWMQSGSIRLLLFGVVIGLGSGLGMSLYIYDEFGPHQDDHST